ncbi:MAG: hypothetical protein OXC05_08105 [Halieaceae bacterium]|nr:hypothetical protein [Halieaceae bacterium]
MRLLLHIGTDKTGTKAIQQHLYLNRDWLQSRGVCIPGAGLGAGNGHAALFEPHDARRLSALAEELRLARRQGFRLAVLSWEGLHNFSGYRIRRLRRSLPVEEITVLVYLREQAAIAQTGYLQLVKELQHRLPVESVEQPRGLLQRLYSQRIRLHPSRNYFRLLERWRRALPQANFVARVYDRERLYRNDVVDDFLLQLALKTGAGFVRLPDNVNTSLDVETALLLQEWRRHGMSEADLRRRIDVSLSTIAAGGGGRRHFLSQAGAAAIRSYYDAANRQLARHYLAGPAAGFDLEKPCWKLDDNRAQTERLKQRAAEIEAVDTTPSHSGPPLRGPAMKQGASLYSGWQTGESWGRWSAGDESRLRLRLWRQHLLPVHCGVRIFIKGRYYGENELTRVLINGQDLGEHHLGQHHPGLELALSRLLPHEVLDIVLQHQHPTSPRLREQTRDKRELAFGIESIGCCLYPAAGFDET